MSTLSELIHYCKEPDPVGALLLTGEWGCGKTYLIDNDLAETLKDTHIIVRVSLFGMKSPEMLHERIRQKWFEACLPVLGALRRARDNTEGILTAANGVIRAIDPVAGSAAEVMISLDALDFVAIKPEVEEFLTHKRKRVILVYDDGDLQKAYPKYSPDDITDAERNWITTGIWDKDGFVAEITA